MLRKIKLVQQKAQGEANCNRASGVGTGQRQFDRCIDGLGALLPTSASWRARGSKRGHPIKFQVRFEHVSMFSKMMCVPSWFLLSRFPAQREKRVAEFSNGLQVLNVETRVVILKPATD